MNSNDGSTMHEFEIACREVIEILSYMPEEIITSIPLDVRNNIAIKSDKKFKTKIDPYKELDKQDISEMAKDLLAYLYRTYIAEGEEQEKINETLLNNDIMYEKLLKEKFDPDKLFRKNINISESSEEVYLEVKQNSLLDRIKDYFISIFREKTNHKR